MKLRAILMLACSGCLLATAACDSNQQPASPSATSETSAPSEASKESETGNDEEIEEERPISSPPASWVEERVRSSNRRLAETRGGRIIKDAIEAHGGLDTWYSNRLLEFRFEYGPIDGGEGPSRDTVQVIDVWSSRARHHLTEQETAEFGWTGDKAWMTTEELAEMNPRFWSLTPYYFVGIPFVLADRGVNLAYEGEWDFEGTTWQMVRATFDDGTGDAPDDYYIVMVNKETSRVGGVRYVVSYPGFFPEGGHSPEKLLTYDGQQRSGGILFPQSFRSFSWQSADSGQGAPGDQTREAKMSRVRWKESAPADYFDMPTGAVEQKEM